MASPTETPARGQGFGARRFLVRGSIYSPEPVPSLLRLRYNEYPERFALEPDFPQAGRRGGSRPRAQELALGDALVPGAPRGGPSGAPLYPAPRDREPGSEQRLGGSLPEASAAGASPVLACLGQGGTHLQQGTNILAGADLATSDGPFTRPFVVRFVSFFCGTLNVPLITARVVVASNNDLSQGFLSGGSSIDQGSTSNVDFRGTGDTQVTYPNKKWLSSPAFIKYLVRNLTAVTIEVQFIVDLEWLD